MVNASVTMATIWILNKIHVKNVGQLVKLAKTHPSVWLVLKDRYLVKLFVSLVSRTNSFQEMNANLAAIIVSNVILVQINVNSVQTIQFWQMDNASCIAPMDFILINKIYNAINVNLPV